MRRCHLLAFVYLVMTNCLIAQTVSVSNTLTGAVLSNKHLSVQISKSGAIQKFVVSGYKSTDTINFRTDKFSGPSFDSIELRQETKGQPVFSAKVKNIAYRIEYKLNSAALMMIASMRNESNTLFKPDVVSLRLGIDNYMESYPQWSKIMFPTLLRSEKSHFWGYFMSPQGRVLSIASPNPIPSWSIGYERFDKFPHYVGSHRIQTSYLDLLRVGILRDRQPLNRSKLEISETIADTIYLTPLASLDDMGKTISFQTKAPTISFDKYTLYPGEVTKAIIHSSLPLSRVQIAQENSQAFKVIDFIELRPFVYQLNWIAPDLESRYIVQVISSNQKQSEAVLYVRANWSGYLFQARKSGLRYLPTTCHHAEAFAPLYSYFLARKHLPDSATDALCEKVYKDVFKELFDPELKEMREGKFRLQDAATMASILADRYSVTKDTNDLVNANGLVEFLIRNQRSDGSYYNYEWKSDYTAVNYVVKKIMEVLTQEYKLAQSNDVWRRRYNAGMHSVPLALNNLYLRKDNLDTEGQMTFDDGPVACCAGQLALGALRSSDTILRDKYLKTALEVLEKHNCLAQDIIPDARMNGATLRFWESQFTINLMHNMMDSPCGWSTRKIFANYYLYLLTGRKELLYKVMNALGACMQLINLKNGDLYFAFTPDPYIQTEQFLPAFTGSRIPVLKPVTVGEQYLPLISDWHTTPYFAWRPTKFGIDNFVHDVFRCAEEIVLQQSYLIENEDGNFETFNCLLERKEGRLIVTPFEKYVKSVHVNLKKRHTFEIKFENNSQLFHCVDGMQWLGEVPEEVRTYEAIL